MDKVQNIPPVEVTMNSLNNLCQSVFDSMSANEIRGKPVELVTNFYRFSPVQVKSSDQNVVFISDFQVDPEFVCKVEQVERELAMAVQVNNYGVDILFCTTLEELVLKLNKSLTKVNFDETNKMIRNFKIFITYLGKKMFYDIDGLIDKRATEMKMDMISQVSKERVSVSIADYFLTIFNIELKDNYLVETRSGHEKFVLPLELCYLVPEYDHLWKRSLTPKHYFDKMKEIILKSKQLFTKSNVSEIPVNVTGRVLPSLYVSDTQSFADFSSKWISISLDPAFSDADLAVFNQNILSSGKIFGYELNYPKYSRRLTIISVEHLKQCLKTIKNEFDCKVLFVGLQSDPTITTVDNGRIPPKLMYETVKSECVQLSIITQCFNTTNINSKTIDYYQELFKNTFPRMNRKFSSIDSKWFQKFPFDCAKTMVVGICVHNPTGKNFPVPLICSAVASTDALFDRFVCCVRVNNTSDTIDPLICVMFNLFKKYLCLNKYFPSNVIILRDSFFPLSSEQMTAEFDTIHSSALFQDINLKLTFIQVQRHNFAHFFKSIKPNQIGPTQGFDLPCGTVVDNKIVGTGEFYLNTSYSKILASPVKYTVFHDEMNFSMNQIQLLCYLLCHSKSKTIFSNPNVIRYASRCALRSERYIRIKTKPLNDSNGSPAFYDIRKLNDIAQVNEDVLKTLLD